MWRIKEKNPLRTALSDTTFTKYIFSPHSKSNTCSLQKQNERNV